MDLGGGGGVPRRRPVGEESSSSFRARLPKAAGPSWCQAPRRPGCGPGRCLPGGRAEPLTHLPPLGSCRRQRRRAAPRGLLHPPTRRPGQPRRKMLPGARLGRFKRAGWGPALASPAAGAAASQAGLEKGWATPGRRGGGGLQLQPRCPRVPGADFPPWLAGWLDPRWRG